MYRRRPWGLYAYAALAYAFLFAPIVVVAVNSFNADRFRIRWGGFTTHWYTSAWSDSSTVAAARTSLIIAVIVAVAATAIGTATALYLRRSGRWTGALVSGTTYARLVIPELLLAIALLILFSRLSIGRGMLTIVIGHVVLNSAYVTVIIGARLAQREQFTEEAARDLGATPFRAFRRVPLPEIMPAVVASAILAFTFSLDNVVSSFFLSGSTNTLPLVILSLIRFEVSPAVNALGMSLTAVTAVAMVAFLLVNRRRSRTEALTRPDSRP